VSSVREEVPSGATSDMFGPNPVGFLSYGADGRMMALIARGDRARPAEHPIGTDAAVNLFRSMMSYAGTYEVRDGEVVHYVDLSANEIWTGTEQRRFFDLDGGRLTLATPVNQDPVDGKTSVRRMVWEKLK
jgi:hypothetical protein